MKRIISFLMGRGRPLAVLLLGAVALTVFALTTDLATHLGHPWQATLGVGIGLMLLAIPCHWFGALERIGYLAAILLNLLGMGAAAGAYFIESGVGGTLTDLLPATVLPLLLLALLCILLAAFPDYKVPIGTLTVLIFIGLLVATVVFWCIRVGDFYAFSFFSHIVTLFFAIVCGVTADEEERLLLRDASLGSFGLFSIIAVVALIALLLVGGGDGCDCDCSGECCDCGDGCNCGDSSRKGKRKLK